MVSKAKKKNNQPTNPTQPLHFAFTNLNYHGIKLSAVSTLPGKSVCGVTEACGMAVSHLSWDSSLAE